MIKLFDVWKILLVLTHCEFVISQFEGDECTREYDNARGICTNHRNCNQVEEDYNRGIPITYCSYLNGQSIVCCPQNERTSNTYPQNARKRLSAQKCEEYLKLTVETVHVWGVLINQNSNERSGIETSKCNPATPLIVGGEIAKTKEFPHMAAIGFKTSLGISFKCGGSLISEQYVLTAAHCSKSDDVNASVVRLGDQNLKSRNDGLRELDIEIAEFIRHPKYNSRTSKNDIAVIKMVSAVEFTDAIRPACLWQGTSINFTKTIATGWGAVGHAMDTSDDLRKVELDIIDNSLCNTQLSNNLGLGREKLTDNTQICAGLLTGSGKDTCEGDSGAPIQVTTPQSTCLYHLIGVTSFGSILCGSQDSPGVYTKVSAYLDWIEQQVWN